MRLVVLLSFLFLLGVLSSDLKLTDSKSSFRASQHKQLKAEKDNFVIGWSNQVVEGYRIATFDEITTRDFVDQYNNQGIYFDIDDDDDDLKCSLSVADGLLLFPKNDTDYSNLMTLYIGTGLFEYGCYLTGSNGYAHFETWPSGWCSTVYSRNYFETLSISFMQDNFYTATEKCDDDDTSITMAIFIHDSVTPTPTPSPSTPTPPPTPSSSYVCCAYYDFYEQFETSFCQVSGQNCPNSISSYVAVGNYTVNDCKDCCNKIYTKKEGQEE